MSLTEQIERVLRDTQINCTGLGEVGCPVVDGWHSWSEHRAHVAAQIAALLPEATEAVAQRRAWRVVDNEGVVSGTWTEEQPWRGEAWVRACVAKWWPGLRLEVQVTRVGPWEAVGDE